MEATGAKEGPGREQRMRRIVNSSGDSGCYFDRNQDVCNISRTMYKGKSSWKSAFRLQNVPDNKNADKHGGRAAGRLWAACVSFLDIFSTITFAAAFICSLEVLVFRESLIVK